MRTIGLLLCAFAASAHADPDLVAAFSFEEEGGPAVRDASPHAHRGRAKNVERVEGKIGRALAFREDDAAVRISRRAPLNLGSQLTLEAWIYPTVADDQSRIIIAKNDEYLLRIDKQPEGGRISFFIHVGTPAVTWEPRVSSQAPPAPNAWHHVVATWDGRKLRLYLDGELQAERDRVGRPNPNPYPVMIGNFEYPSCHGGNFGGMIDEVRIYGRALSAAEIGKRYSVANRSP